jgi:hypothetical protein
MWSNRRRSEANRRAVERRQREDACPRLTDEVPDLSTLELEIHERHNGSLAEVLHMRRVIVEHAPALFEVPCADRGCKEGGHDLTAQIVPALRRRLARFQGEHICCGRLGAGTCGRVLHYVATATYRVS